MKNMIIVPLLLSAVSLGVNAASQKGNINPALSYEIGGYSKLPSRKIRTITPQSGIAWDNNLMCGNFDMSLSVSNVMNGVSGEVTKLAEDLITSATGLVSNTLWIEIARADPLLYEVMQQGKLEASELFSGSVASCKEMTDDVINGGGHEDWVAISGYEDWVSVTKTGSSDVILTADSIEESRGNSGVKWLGGSKKGGKGQEPIRVERDVVRAGYNALAGRSSTSKGSVNPNSENAPAFSKFWSSPLDAEDWITDVIGDTEIRTCIQCQRISSKSGKGAYSYLEKSQLKIEKELNSLINSNKSNFTYNELSKVSSPGLPITQQVIEALRKETIYKDLLIGKLAEEVAVNDLIERLIAARQILISGKRDAYVSENREAVKVIEKRISLINDEMELIRQDLSMREATTKSVALKLLQRQTLRAETGKPVGNGSTPISNSIRNITGR
ncbi:integrating conjugative element protein [Vibrio rotiferianus]|uniref:integrating conjugative element protein n=1 Tax=Vibrio rotiferianus TaxID=190895 RepID=UPI000A50F44E|nr:integrating conjugative element protein [Vibrio rotiferianus]